MAVVAKVSLPNFSKERYEALRTEIGWLDEPPRGGISPIAWWEGDDCCGLDVWESEADWNAFGQERMGLRWRSSGTRSPRRRPSIPPGKPLLLGLSHVSPEVPGGGSSG